MSESREQDPGGAAGLPVRSETQAAQGRGRVGHPESYIRVTAQPGHCPEPHFLRVKVGEKGAPTGRIH